MSTNKFSKYVIDNIVVGTPISSIVAAGATIGLDSADVIALIDSDYVQQRETSGLDSAEVIALIDSDYVAARTPAANGGGLDSAAALDLFAYGIEEVGANQRQVAVSLNTFVDPFNQTGNNDRAFNLNYTSTTGMFIRETGGRTEIHADASGTGQSTGLLLIGASFGNNGTEIAGNLKLSSLPTTDPAETGLLWNDGGIPVFSGSTAPTGEAGLDSAAVEGIVDSAYVQARQTPQDFAYSSLTGAPTALSSFTNDTNYITAADIPATVDSDYVAARTPAPNGGGLDSAGVQGIVDDNITGGIASVQIGPSASVANALQQTVIGPSASSNGQYNVAIGRNATVQSSQTAGTAVGNDARVGSSQGGNNGVAIGTNARVERDAGTAIGPNAYVKNGSNATAVGMQANAWGASALALGHGAAATSSNTIAIGTNTSASTQYEIDIRTSAAGSLTYDTTNDWVFGATVNAPAFVGDGSGLTNLPSGGGGLDSAGVTSLIDSDYVQLKGLFYTGTDKQSFGPDAGFQSTSAFSVAVGRSAGANSVNSTNSIAIGYKAGFASQGQSIHIGRETGEVNPGSNLVSIGTEANQYNAGASSVAIGYRAAQNGGGSGSITIGRDARAAGANSVSVGQNSEASQADMVVIGPNATGGAQNAVIIGHEATASGSWAVVIGDQAEGTGTETVAIGNNTLGGAGRGVAIGDGASTANGTVQAIAIGNDASTTVSDAIAIGDNSSVTSQFGIDIRTSAAGSLTYDTTNDWTFGAGVTMTDLTSSGVVIFSALPTTDPVNAGQLWNDSGTLKVSAG